MSEFRDRHDQVSRIFLEASELPRDKRRAFLDSACNGDSRLREEVELLLQGHEDVPELLKPGGLRARLGGQASPRPERLEGFRIQEEVGVGGMGVVYRAVQEEGIRREVAIKLIKRGFETDRVLARFEAERQSLALMNHPNIAQVFEARATEDGRPFIIMEYIEGRPITTFCEEEGLDVRSRLELFVQVCDGIQHAHQKAVIHRDVKPSNVLVTLLDGRPVPKIIDFGVAKATEHRFGEQTLYTEAGQLVGTPEYMSPEQAAMNPERIDTRTDVYSLGVMLYVLLTGTQPLAPSDLQRKSLDEIRQQILEVDPPSPSKRTGSRRLRGELDWITMRAIEKDPARRYRSPGELAEDVRRYLSGETVLAGPPSHIYRTARLVRKHKIATLTVAAVTISLLAIAITAGVQARRIAAERNRADAAGRQAIQKAAAARQVSDFLVGIFHHSTDRDVAREQVDAALARLRRDLPAGSVELARLSYPLGQIYDNLGFDEGAMLVRESLETLRGILGPEDLEVLTAMHTHSVRLAEHSRLDEAEALMQEVLEARRRTLGVGHSDTLSVMTHLARVLEMQERFDDAESLLFEALPHSRNALGEEHPLTLRNYGYIGTLRFRQGRLDDAERRFREVLPRLWRALGPSHRYTLGVLFQLGALRARVGDRDEALALIEQAIGLGWDYRLSEGRRSESAVEGMRKDPDLAGLRGDPRYEAIAGPEGYLTALDAARESVVDRDYPQALQHLRLAVDRGLRTQDTLLRDDSLLPLHVLPEFRQLVGDLPSGNQRFPGHRR